MGQSKHNRADGMIPKPRLIHKHTSNGICPNSEPRVGQVGEERHEVGFSVVILVEVPGRLDELCFRLAEHVVREARRDADRAQQLLVVLYGLGAFAEVDKAGPRLERHGRQLFVGADWG
jgi:hypothetical protein